MKKILTILALFALLTACQKDTNPPVVRINGPDTLFCPALGSITFPNDAIAFDEEDFDISSKVVIVGTYDNTRLGYYPIVYQATDEAGNVGSASRIVRVGSSPASLAGTWRSTNNCLNCTALGVSTISVVNNFAYQMLISPPLGTASTGYGDFQIIYTDKGEFVFRYGRIPCDYLNNWGAIYVSPSGDHIRIDYDYYFTWTSHTTTRCTIDYVRI